ncbi:LDL3 [Symbiodinium pilosum]|uniref:LDL3 protein n=1 Tax=Symbiodinium pilosum TaxID=2952 RepID=A0A812JHJ1_SYMPI|nr:LDL3 [Symbiodinium pilosum]
MALVRFYNLVLEQIGGDTDFEGRYDQHRLLHAGKVNDSLKAEAPEKSELAFRRYAKAKELFERKVPRVLSKNGIIVGFDFELRSGHLVVSQDPLLEWQLRVRSEQNWGTSAQQVGTTLAEIATYSVFYSDDETILDSVPVWPEDRKGDAKLVGGFSTLVRELTKGLNVRLNAAVSSISLEDAVAVHTVSGATYQGAAVIVTVPLGVLQQKLRFQPPLPKDWYASLQRLQMGDVAKLFIKFKGGLSPISSDTYLLSQVVSHTSRNLLYYCIREVSASMMSPSVTLTCLLSGPSFEEAMQLKQTGKEALLNRVVAELSQMYPQMQPSAVSAVQMRSFSWNPFVLGSWTSGKVGSSSQDFSIFEPRPRLAFAGEHTCRLMYGTVQAAAVSGARSAHEVLAAGVGKLAPNSWPFFRKDLYTLCDELAPGANEHCGLSCQDQWRADLVASLFQSWRGMTKKARRCWSRLGWRPLSWAGQARKPTTSNKDWKELSFAARAAATCLGFTTQSWEASGLPCMKKKPSV